jgi:hypothetical protein
MTNRTRHRRVVVEIGGVEPGRGTILRRKGPSLLPRVATAKFGAVFGGVAGQSGLQW